MSRNFMLSILFITVLLMTVVFYLGTSHQQNLYDRANDLGFGIVQRLDDNNYIAMDIKTGYAYNINISKSRVTIGGAALDGAGKHIKYEFKEDKK